MARGEYKVKSFRFEGKRYYCNGATSEEAAQKVGSLKKELELGVKKIDNHTTVEQWAKVWLKMYIESKDATAKSIAMYQQKLDNYILPEIGTMKLGDVKDVHLQGIINHANSSFSTAQKVRITIKSMFHRAYRSRIIQYDPSEDLIIPKAPKGKRRSITDAEREAILAVAPKHQAGPWVLTMLYCGLRDNEIIPLQWKDVDLKAELIHVRTALKSGTTDDVREPKTPAGIRDVPYPEELQTILEPLRGSPIECCFLQPQGHKMHTSSSLNDAWNNFKRALDIYMGAKVYRNQIIVSQVAPDLTAYCLRHTFGTDMQRAGIAINVAKYLMGHSDISVTANIYTDTTPDVVKKAAIQFDKFRHPRNDATRESDK